MKYMHARNAEHEKLPTQISNIKLKNIYTILTFIIYKPCHVLLNPVLFLKSVCQTHLYPCMFK